jgi:hypothetical protein
MNIAWLQQCGNWLKRVVAWLAEAQRLWLALFTVLLVVVLSWLTVPGWETRLRIAGCCLELLGLAIVAYGLRDTRKLFRQPSLLQLWRDWLARFPTFYRHIHVVAATGTFTLGGDALTAFGSVSLSPTASLDERVIALEKNLNQTNALVQQMQKQREEDTRKQAAALDSERRARETEDEKNQRLLEEALAGGLHLETIGVVWLLIGIILSTLSTELALLFNGS